MSNFELLKGQQMKQVITVPDESWIDYIAKMCLLGSQISKETIGTSMDGTRKDLERIQKTLDGNHIPLTSTQELQSLGIVFGKVFVNETPGYDWWVVEDEFGKDACIRYQKTSLLVFPQTMISKRVEDGTEISIEEIYSALGERLESIKQEIGASA